MFRKVHDRMFNKAQMKLFGMIVSILLAVFIALIIGINVITEAVMSEESKEVLQDIAASLGYDEKKASFYLTSSDVPWQGSNSNPPPKPAEDQKVTSSADTTVTSSGTAPSSTEATAENTDDATVNEENTEGDNSENNNSETDNEPQQTEPKSEEYTWFAIPTYPGASDKSNNGGLGWGDWNSQNGQSGQSWGGGNQYWGQWTEDDWKKWSEQNGGQDWSQWTEDDWKKWSEQNGGQNWSQWKNQDWSQWYNQNNAGSGIRTGGSRKRRNRP